MDTLNIIKDIKIDNVIIHICDNSFAKTIEEEKIIIENFSKTAYELCKNIKGVS